MIPDGEPIREQATYERPAYSVPAQRVEVVEVQGVMVRVRHSDGMIGAMPIRDFRRLYGPVEP